MNMNEKPNFDIINKNKIAIKSLRTQLAKAKSVAKLTEIAAEIVELETQIAFEKSAGYRKYQEEKKKISSKIDKLQRTLKRSESLISIIDKHIEHKTSGKELKENIDELHAYYVDNLKKINASS